MKNICENPMVKKACGAMRSLSDIRIKKDYNMTLSIYDANSSDSPECTHTLKGSSDQSLLKMLAVAGVVAVTVSAVCGVCSLFRKD